MPRSDDRKFWPERHRDVSTAEYRDEYDGLEDDQGAQEPETPVAGDADPEPVERTAEVNMSELLRHAKVKGWGDLRGHSLFD